MKWHLADFRETTALFCALAIFAAGAIAAETAPFVVSTTSILDEKAVFATVESLKVVPARVRINGTVAEVRVVEGDQVKAGQVIGSVGDEKLALQILALETRIAGLQSQSNLAATDLKRMKELFKKGSISQANLDSARTAVDVTQSALKTVNAERDVIRRQLNEGAVLAPVSGRVLTVPITSGTVVMPGEVLATLAEENYILRLEIPERHARHMKLKDPVRIDGAELDEGVAAEGHISRIYPRIDNGRVYADAQVDGLGTYFVGQRIQVWIPAGERQGVVIPRNLVQTRAGIDWVRLANGKGDALELPVQLGRQRGDEVEVLSGLRSGDQLLAPAP